MRLSDEQFLKVSVIMCVILLLINLFILTLNLRVQNQTVNYLTQIINVLGDDYQCLE